jgi:hypothetical protein
MKTAIYIAEGVTQLVLTPENEWEKSVICAVEKGDQHVTIKRGGFYDCNGGFYREGGDNSLIIRLDFKTVDESGFNKVPMPIAG